MAGSAARERLSEGHPGTEDIGFYLAEGNPQFLRNFVVRHLFKVKQDQRHALMLRQSLQGPADPFLPLLGIEVPDKIIVRGKFDLLSIVRRGIPMAGKLREEPPPVAVARQVVQRQIGRDGLKPTPGRRADPQSGESFIRFQEDLLGNILRLRLVSN